MRNMLRNRRIDKSLEMMKNVLKIADVFTRPIIENIEEENGESPSELSINVLQLDLTSEMLISPTVEWQELDNWEVEDIPMLYFE